jgi:DNA-binding NarL/FixJ family response regulator
MTLIQNIIHLDDHDIFQDGLRNLLQKQMEIVSLKQFGHPIEAIEFIEACLETGNRPNLVITDYNHPGLNGYEFAKAIRKLEIDYGVYIPILLFSMMDGEPVIQQGLEERVFNCALPKSAHTWELVEAIEDLCH